MIRAALLLILTAALAAQPYDLLLKGGHVIDPASGIDAVRDVAVTGNNIARVAADIAPAQAKKTVDVKGLYVTPGLIDLHAHVYGYSGSIFPDDTALVAGTTTVVDAGGSGHRTFDDFKKTIISRTRARVLALINIAGGGMTGSASEDNVADMLPEKTAAVIKANRDSIVGIKCAHFGKPGWDAIDRARKVGILESTPLIRSLAESDRILENRIVVLKTITPSAMTVRATPKMELAMNKYTISNSAGVVLGVYPGRTPEEALDAMARDIRIAGYGMTPTRAPTGAQTRAIPGPQREAKDRHGW